MTVAIVAIHVAPLLTVSTIVRRRPGEQLTCMYRHSKPQKASNSCCTAVRDMTRQKRYMYACNARQHGEVYIRTYLHY